MHSSISAHCGEPYAVHRLLQALLQSGETDLMLPTIMFPSASKSSYSPRAPPSSDDINAHFSAVLVSQDVFTMNVLQIKYCY